MGWIFLRSAAAVVGQSGTRPFLMAFNPPVNWRAILDGASGTARSRGERLLAAQRKTARSLRPSQMRLQPISVI